MQKSTIQKISLALVFTVVGLGAGWLFFSGPSNNAASNDTNVHAHSGEEEVWTCSMDPQVRQNEPGQCPICGMGLIQLKTNAGSSEQSSLVMSDDAVRLGNIQTTQVSKGPVQKTIQLQGKVAVDERKVFSQVTQIAGRIEHLYVTFTGERVGKGQKLASIYSAELVVAQNELLEAAKSKSVNPALYHAARKKMKQWKFSDRWIDDIEQSGVIQNTVDITAEVSGIVLTKKANIGDHLTPGQTLFEIGDLSSLWVLFAAYESDLYWIKKKDSISFKLPALPGQLFKEEITFIDPILNEKTRTAAVRIEMRNKDRHFKPGMFVNGEIASYFPARDNEIIVPKSAVLWTGKRSVVYISVPNTTQPTFEFREVNLGIDLGEAYTVTSGLSDGESVVTNGAFKVDAAAQIAGKQSMMNRDGSNPAPVHNHGGMPGNSDEMSMNDDNSSISKAEFNVAGNCVMCKNRIEAAATSIAGVTHASWDETSKLIQLHFDPDQTSDAFISEAIASVGHDTELHKANDAVYDSLPGCCKYDRLN